MGEADLTILLEQAIEQGGTERVAEAVIRARPDARVLSPAFDATNVPPAELPAWLDRVEYFGVRRARRRPLLAPLYAREVAAAPVGRTRVLLSFTGHGWSLAAPAGAARHVTYSTGLPRSLYGDTVRYRRAEPAAVRPVARAALPWLRAHHAGLMRRADRVLTNSRPSAQALREHYGIEAEVLHPPVLTDHFTPAPGERAGVLIVSRLVEPKRIDVALEAVRRA